MDGSINAPAFEQRPPTYTHLHLGHLPNVLLTVLQKSFDVESHLEMVEALRQRLRHAVRPS